MTDEEVPYDLNSALIVPSEKGLIFAGAAESEILKNNVGQPPVTVSVLYFPYQEIEAQAVASGRPRRYMYTGKLLSAFWNEAQTKGVFRFEDGTLIYFDKAFVN